MVGTHGLIYWETRDILQPSSTARRLAHTVHQHRPWAILISGLMCTPKAATLNQLPKRYWGGCESCEAHSWSPWPTGRRCKQRETATRVQQGEAHHKPRSFKKHAWLWLFAFTSLWCLEFWIKCLKSTFYALLVLADFCDCGAQPVGCGRGSTGTTTLLSWPGGMCVDSPRMCSRQWSFKRA